MDETTSVESLGAEREARSPGGAGQALRNLMDVAGLDPGLAALVVMAVAGILISIYLTIVHYDAKIPLVCPTSGHINCELVTSSQWSLVPFTTVPITFPGMLWFVVSGGLAIKLLGSIARGEPESRRVRQVQLVWSSLGMLTVIYLVYVEIVRLGFTFCEWCTVVHLLTFASLLIVADRFARVPLVPAQVAPRPAVRAPVKPTSNSNGAPKSNGASASADGRPSSTVVRSNGTRTGHSTAARPGGAARPKGANGARPASSARRPTQKARSKR